MRVLVACEFSGTVRDAFRARGHDAWSCDVISADPPSRYHIRGDVQQWLNDAGPWDLMVAHPPCTHLAVSGARWWPHKLAEQAEAIRFVRWLADAPVPRIAIENPIGKLSTAWRKPDQIIQPWQYGHGETKATCLWLKGLPLLQPTNVVAGRENRIHKMPPSPDRGKLRSIFYRGIAAAMAEQWGGDAQECAA